MASTFAAVGTEDFLYCAGGGIMGHPGGTAAGVMSLRQAAEAAMAGIPIDDYARDHGELAAALSLFKDRR
jgi:ribulose-bisphosphate carboxylase large chain